MKNNAFSLSTRLDILGLMLAGLINTFLALFDAALILGPGTRGLQDDLLTRAIWISDHILRWQLGWLFWFVVTLSFAWSFFALGRHLAPDPPWPALAIGLALVAAAVDLVGVLIYLVVLPDLAGGIVSALESDAALLIVFQSMENVAYALTNVTAFGLYSLAGILLLPAVWATAAYPRWLAWLGTAEWGLATVATLLLIITPGLATAPLLISFALYAPWVWGSAYWLARGRREAGPVVDDSSFK